MFLYLDISEKKMVCKVCKCADEKICYCERWVNWVTGYFSGVVGWGRLSVSVRALPSIEDDDVAYSGHLKIDM